MRLRALGHLAVGGLIVAAAAVPLTSKTAHAETCVPLGGTPGATIHVGDESVTVPSTSGIAVCVEPAGLPGIPWVSTDGCGSPCASVIVTGGSGGDGYVAVRYTVEGSPQEVRVPIPGGGGGTEVCYAGVGAPARADCFVRIDIHPGGTPSPIPTLPPVSPEPLPTIDPTPTIEPICTRPTGCIPEDFDPIAFVQWVCSQIHEALACF
jgi:hypothetical protein